MTSSSSLHSRSLTIELGPTFGLDDSDTERIRNSQVEFLDSEMAVDFIFAVETPLEVAGVATAQSTGADPLNTPPTSLSLVPSGEATIRGVKPDLSIRNRLGTEGNMEMGVDSLSRSILLSDIDEHMIIEAVREQADLDTKSLEAMKKSLLAPTFSGTLDEAAADQAQRLLTENIRRHESSHIDCLINPETALWRELELYWRSILIGANPQTWTDSDFLQRFIQLYSIPSHFVIELLGMLSEDYTTAEPSVRYTVKNSVVSRRGVAGTLMQFLEEERVDPEALRETIRSPTGEQFCDLWLAYVVDELRSGYSLSEIDTSDFRNHFTTSFEKFEGCPLSPETRTLFTDFIYERCFGPVFEVVRLDIEKGQFVLKRAWYSLNQEVSDRGDRLAVRRALYRREFLSLLEDTSGLKTARESQETAIERVLRGASLDDVALFDASPPSPEQLSEFLAATYESTATVLLGAQATSEDLQYWLNDPEYGSKQIMQE